MGSVKDLEGQVSLIFRFDHMVQFRDFRRLGDVMVLELRVFGKDHIFLDKQLPYRHTIPSKKQVLILLLVEPFTFKKSARTPNAQ